MADPYKPPSKVGDVTGKGSEIPDIPQVPGDRGRVPGAAGERPTPDGMQGPLPHTRLGQTIQTAMRHMDGSAMQSFRIPGTNQVVHDRREQTEKGRDVAKEGDKSREAKETEDKRADASRARGAADGARKEGEIKDGAMREARAKEYENYLSDRVQKLMQALAKQIPEKAKEERPLSEFEKLVMERFEQAKKLEGELAEGKKASFLEKTVEQWKEFFGKFASRTAKKSLELAEIQEFLFRGLVKKDAAKAVLISDIIQNGGKTEKFARFSILYQKINDFLSKLSPGDVISKQSLADGLTAERLLYLALLPASLEQEMLTGKQPTQGLFASEAVEARVAEELGIVQDRGGPSHAHGASAKGKKKKRGGIKGFFGGGDDEVIPDSGQFIPWWQWGTLKRPGGFTLKKAFYTAVITLFIIVMILLIDRFLLGK